MLNNIHTGMLRRMCMLLLPGLVLFAGSAMAEGLAWSELNAQQQQVLAPLKDRWATLPPQRQEHLSKGATRWAAMNPEQRARAKANCCKR